MAVQERSSCGHGYGILMCTISEGRYVNKMSDSLPGRQE